ncbi:metal ABC transporter substrate-binding protein [Nocardioides sp. LHD-245]|uniref:metal ABC transporter substrate-binding protein n=1 Tax=Nocardioides sp. LHD-245 TaxID=3051387 RepID=UPI0027DF7EF9|nr:metal ABC transporter substrate-binding protein [Nocardioides sp. LHD-245]
MRSWKTLAALTALTLSTTACSALSEDDGSGSDAGGSTTDVVAAFYPLEYVAARVAGDRATVTSLTKAGVEPHDLEINVQDTARIAKADLVVFESEFQPAVDETVAENAGGETLDVTDVVELEPFEEHADEHTDEHADEEGEHADEHADEHAGEDGEEGHDHEHGEFDPHFWHDPIRVATYGDAVAASLAELDPAHADDYEANAADLRSDLEALDEEFTTGLATCERDTIVVSHDAFGYLEKYGLHMAPIAGLTPDAEPTPAAIAELQQLIEQEGITTVFSETLVSPKLAETLAGDLGIASKVLDPIEGLTEDTADQDYLSLMRSNLAALRTANGCS